MIIKHKNKSPLIDSSSFVAPNSVICGDVTIGKNVRVMFGAQIIAESSPITIGDNSIILENAVIRGTEGNPVSIGQNCLIGPNSHIAGCTLENNVFVATGASIFHGAIIKKGAEIRINGVVHLKSVVSENEIVPINWVAVGNPAELFPPDKHEEIYKIQKPLDFPNHVYGLNRENDQNVLMPKICKIMGQRLGEHFQDEIQE